MEQENTMAQGGTRVRSLRVAATLIVAAGLASAAFAQDSPEGILQRTRATYAALSSYSDSGVVVVEFSASAQDRHTFTTYFSRAPRHFLFDFHKERGDRFVVWGDPDAYHTWWKTTDQQSDYPNPKNVDAINLSDFPTAGSVTKITTLLYPKAALVGALSHFADATLDGTEDIGGQRCFRLVGRTSDLYGATGKEVNFRKLTVWIDAKSLLVRQVREESKAPPGALNRKTTTMTPEANPSLAESRFKFTPPASE
jgi:outer membrane lipoprotein-sorting protein